jgi:hypothetical protein
MIPLAAGLALSAGSFGTIHAKAASGALGHVTFLGESTPAGGTSGSANSLKDATAPGAVEQHGSAVKPVKLALSNPSPQGTALAGAGGSSGFQGLSHVDQRLAGTGKYAGTQFSLEPPDQGLCVGNGFVLESVNDAFAVYTPLGTSLTGPIAFNQFFNLAPAIIRSTGVTGDFLSDPKCYFDTATGRWFQTILQVDAPGDFTAGAKLRTHVLIAVSKSGDPTGGWRVFSLNTTDNGTGGTPNHAGCPCLPDQPLIGANRDGFFISTNEFQFINFPSTPFNGAQVYAFSKTALETSGTPGFVQFDTGTIPTGDANLQFWGSIQPAASPTKDSQARMSSSSSAPGPRTSTRTTRRWTTVSWCGRSPEPRASTMRRLT